MTNLICHCGSEKRFTQCCQAYLRKLSLPEHPEALMRSRYSAYVEQDYAYVLTTYAPEKQKQLTISELKNASVDTQWLKLDVLGSFADSDYGEVEFIAYYKIEQSFYAMHELSRFVKQGKQWFYLDGEMLNKSGAVKLSRNATCLCGSGKKFKRCCAL
jgi:SEC-C motif-containing protein